MHRSSRVLGDGHGQRIKCRTFDKNICRRDENVLDLSDVSLPSLKTSLCYFLLVTRESKDKPQDTPPSKVIYLSPSGQVLYLPLLGETGFPIRSGMTRLPGIKQRPLAFFAPLRLKAPGLLHFGSNISCCTQCRLPLCFYALLAMTRQSGIKKKSSASSAVQDQILRLVR